MRKLFAALVAVALCAAAGAAQAQNSPAAQRVLDRARAASGGTAGWNQLRGLHEVGQDGADRYEAWLDPLRYGLRTETQTPAGKLVQGYNGAGEWRILANGVLTGSVDRNVLAEVRSDAFFGAYAYYYPSRFDLRSSHLGVRQSAGRSFDVLRVQPAGGKPRELWFDRATGLLGLVIEETGPRPLMTDVLDYRRVGPVLVPHRFVTYGGDLARSKVRVVEKMEFKPADRAMFSLAPAAGK